MNLLVQFQVHFLVHHFHKVLLCFSRSNLLFLCLLEDSRLHRSTFGSNFSSGSGKYFHFSLSSSYDPTVCYQMLFVTPLTKSFLPVNYDVFVGPPFPWSTFMFLKVQLIFSLPSGGFKSSSFHNWFKFQLRFWEVLSFLLKFKLWYYVTKCCLLIL